MGNEREGQFFGGTDCVRFVDVFIDSALAAEYGTTTLACN